MAARRVREHLPVLGVERRVLRLKKADSGIELRHLHVPAAVLDDDGARGDRRAASNHGSAGERRHRLP